MSIATRDFRRWLETALPYRESMEAVVEGIAGYSYGAVRAQLHKGAVHEALVVLISRKYGRPPLQDLSFFPGYDYLTSAPVEPRDRLSLVPYQMLVNTLFRRTQEAGIGHPIEVPLEVQSVPEPLAFRSWFEDLDRDSELVKHLSKTPGLPGHIAIYRRIRESNPTVPLVVEAARACGRSAAVGLVAMKLLTLDEIGESPSQLDAAAEEVPLELLIELVELRGRLVLKLARAFARDQRSLQNTVDYL
jgi:hypothetical protein